MHRKSFLSRIWDASVWGGTTIPEEDDRARAFLRFVVPPYFLIQFLFAFTGLQFSVPAIYTALSPQFGIIWSALVMVASFLCMFTATFPKLIAGLNAPANSAYTILQLLYVVCLVYLAFFSGDVDGRAADRSATAVRSIGGLLIPIWVAYDSNRERKAGSH